MNSLLPKNNKLRAVDSILFKSNHGNRTFPRWSQWNSNSSMAGHPQRKLTAWNRLNETGKYGLNENALNELSVGKLNMKFGSETLGASMGLVR